jgi:hypothetical protein
VLTRRPLPIHVCRCPRRQNLRRRRVRHVPPGRRPVSSGAGTDEVTSRRQRSSTEQATARWNEEVAGKEVLASRIPRSEIWLEISRS